MGRLADLGGVPDNGHVNAVLFEVIKGRDGKLYPPRMPLPRADLNRARWAAHRLICGQGLSYRAAQAVMRDERGIRRSLGTIAYDIRNFNCGAGCLSAQAGGDHG